MAAGVVELRRLQRRLEELEQRVNGGICGPRKVPRGSATPGNHSAPPGARPGARRLGLTGLSPSFVPLQLADELVKVQVELSNIAGKRERIKILFK